MQCVVRTVYALKLKVLSGDAPAEWSRPRRSKPRRRRRRNPNFASDLSFFFTLSPRAASTPHTVAMSTLNPAEIRKLKKLADDGDSEAAWTLAMHYGRERESTLFNEHVTRAAELGLLEAQVILAVGNSCMSTGIRMEEDEVFSEHMVREARYWTHKVSTDHGAEGKFELAKAYISTAEASEANKQGEAVQLLKEAANEGHTQAMRWLCDAYAYGHLGSEANAVMSEHWAREAAKKGDDEEAVKFLVVFQTAKGNALLNICKVAGMPAPSRETVKRYISGPLPDHSAMTAFSYFAHCLIHGECGFEKNLRLAKDLLKVSIGALKTLEKDPAPDKALLKQLRRCHGCGKYAYWSCKLCRDVRYCSRTCQKWHWKHGDGSGSGNHPCKYYELRHVIAHPTR